MICPDKISLEQVVGQAKEQLGIYHSSENQYLRKLACEAEGLIATSNSFKRYEEVPLLIEDCQSTLPWNTYVIDRLYIPGANPTADNPNPTQGFCPIYRQPTINAMPNSPNSESSFANHHHGGMVIEFPYIFFDSDITGNTALLSYYGTNVDEDGMPIITGCPDHVVAVENYICYKYAVRADYPQWKVAEYKTQWSKRCDKARAQESALSKEEMYAVSCIWNNIRGYGRGEAFTATPPPPVAPSTI